MTTLLSTLALAVRVSLTSRVVGAASWAYSCREMEGGRRGARGAHGGWEEGGGRWRGGEGATTSSYVRGMTTSPTPLTGSDAHNDAMRENASASSKEPSKTTARNRSSSPVT